MFVMHNQTLRRTFFFCLGINDPRHLDNVNFIYHSLTLPEDARNSFSTRETQHPGQPRLRQSKVRELVTSRRQDNDGGGYLCPGGER
jgi:hypothetical protein